LLSQTFAETHNCSEKLAVKLGEI
jgi:hypothetical protein